MNNLLAMQAAPVQPNRMPDKQRCEGHCPSCGSHTQFVYCGEQEIPAKVALALNLPTVVQLWHCTSCWSTITAHDLRME